jgi:hypothetical protein
MLDRGVRRQGIYLIGGRRGGRGWRFEWRIGRWGGMDDLIGMCVLICMGSHLVWYTHLILVYGHGHGCVVMSIRFCFVGHIMTKL